jgi:hypothetical protein
VPVEGTLSPKFVRNISTCNKVRLWGMSYALLICFVYILYNVIYIIYKLYII